MFIKMYVRFTILDSSVESHRYAGVFLAIFALLEGNELNEVERQHIDSVIKWFNKNLAEPTRFSVSSRPNAYANAISWFKPTALEHIAKMRQLVDILERHGRLCQMLKETRVGYITYEDEYQVVAVPFRDTRA